MKRCLDDFCSLSGQKVNFEKSMVCVSPNTCPVLAQNIAYISGSPLSDNLVTSAIPIYYMQIAMLPASVCNKLDQLNKNFLWGHAFDKAKVHLVNWETVCKPKCAGGLGVKNVAWMNQALLAKFGWRLLHNEQGLWAKVLKKEWCCSVKHIFREQNFFVDSLASMSHDLPLGLHVLDLAPGVVVELLATDARSLASPRMVVVSSFCVV
ncbi:hypothetical protein L3X38_004714 [Prunus dulcis]|uniref:Uncharacterized protein n=1 Tax=Prunus dulcis TaxID=3755 RepID=A0AAD4ZPH2_PRUDU|nr:hypothetical protein L3X38_004714 [Prunus dulcis]